MQSKKVTTKQEAIDALLDHVRHMIPMHLEEREEMRDNLKELYLHFINDEEMEFPDENRQFYRLYFYFDRFLKLCKDIAPSDFRELLENKNLTVKEIAS